MCTSDHVLISVSFLQFQFKENVQSKRTKEKYIEHCADLGGPLHDHVATTYGVVRNCILNNLTYFHVTTGLVPDIMHNILEDMDISCR